MADVDDIAFKESSLERSVSFEEADHKPIIVHIPRVAARTITGPANIQNQGAIDWGHHGLLTYGSNYTVVVIDVKNIQPIQCLDRHKSMVNKVLWEKPRQNRASSDTASLGLVSSDTTGHIIVWDVTTGLPTAVLQEGSKPVLDMKWVQGYDNSDYKLAALHPPYSLVIWDTQNKTKLWKKTYTENLLSFDFDSFDPLKLAFLCTDCILFVDDFTLSKVPSSNGRKFYISSPRVTATQGGRGSLSNLTAVGLEEKQRTKDRLRRLMKELVVGETKPKPDDLMTVSECLQLQYHNSLRHHLLLLYAREVVVLDLHINQTVGIIPLEKTASPLMQVISTQQRDVLYCLHESGSVSVKFRRRQLTFVGSPLDAPTGSVSSLDMGSMTSDVLIEMGYEQRCQSEVIRLTKTSKVLGMALNPINERHIALFINTGKLVFLEMRPANGQASVPFLANPLARFQFPGEENRPSVIHQDMKTNQRKETLGELIGPLMMESCPPVPPLRLLVTGLLVSAASPLTVIRMCPPLTTRNWLNYRPIMAGGTASGLVQIYNMATGTVDKELAVHSSVVRGIEWTSLNSFLSYSYPAVTGSQSLVRNELLLTNTLTGHSTSLRTDKGEEAPIDMIRVSPLKQYFVVIQKDGPFELWDLRNLCMLRTMPKKFPNVLALEWSPIHNLKSLKKRIASMEEKEQTEPTNLLATTPLDRDDEKQLVAREHFVFSDSESQLYHFSVEGNIFRDGIKIPPEAGVGTVTCIAFKNDQIVQADVDGTLNIWDLRARTSKNILTGRGWVKKMRFAPGKGNLKLLILYSDGVDVVDLKKTFERLSQLKCPKDMVKVLDIDWAASDKPVLVTQDGCLRIMDMMLTTSSSPLTDYEFQYPLCCPALLPSDVSTNLQVLLSGQMWQDEYTLDFSTKQGFTGEQIRAVNEQLSMLDEELVDYLKCCPQGTAERSLLAAQIFGDQSDVDFWTVALYYLQTGQLESRHARADSEQTGGGDQGSPSVLDTKRINRYPHVEPLDTRYDVLCDGYTYQRLQLERVGVHESKRGDYRHTKRVIEQLILLGEMDRAVQLLLETEMDNAAYYTDAIKACLVATIQSTGAAQSTIKLVATNLIANGNVWEGVQLLCLIGKGLDACRYLLSYGMWESAVWLAKAVLPYKDTQEVMRKWADHLWANGQKNKAVLVTLSMGQFERALELLGTQRMHARAGLLLQACREFNLVSQQQATTDPLLFAVQLDFARLLFTLGNHTGAINICEKLGDLAFPLLQEFKILSSAGVT